MTKKYVKKPTTFLSNRSPSNSTLMDISITPHSTTRQEIIHFSHPQHHLVQVTFPYIFTCIGCKEYGAGKRFKCERCDLDLHDFCALAPPSIQRHPFHSHHQLVFYAKQGNGFLRSRCDICAKATRGYVFRCSQCNFEMHPSCATLSQEMSFPVHQHVLNLLPMTTLANSSESSFVCGECKRKRLGRVYACKVCDYHLHAVCAKGMINGLYANGIKPPENQSMLGAAAKIASHVIMGFIGGLIEGIGEGVGEVLVENIGRGNCGNRRRTK